MMQLNLRLVVPVLSMLVLWTTACGTDTADDSSTGPSAATDAGARSNARTSSGGGDEPDGGTTQNDDLPTTLDAGTSTTTDSGPSASLSCAESFCGGELMGAWHADSICSFEPDLEQCPEATAEVDVEVTGEGLFNEDETYDIEVSFTGTGVITVPSSCLPSFVTSCALLEALDDQLSCSGDPSTGCTCRTPIDHTETLSGNWATDGDMVVATDEDGDEERFGYCVDGTYLTLQTKIGRLGLRR